MRGLSRAQERVLGALLERGGSSTITQLSASTGLHENTLRGHLDTLLAKGAVTREREAPSGRGRPGWRWRAVESAHTEYAGLATALARTLKTTSRHPAEDAIEAGHAWGRDLAAHRLATGPDARRNTVALLGELGFSPQVSGRTEVRLTRCPLLEAAKEEPTIVCNVHLGLVAGALDSYGADDPDVRLTPFAERGACLLRMTTD